MTEINETPYYNIKYRELLDELDNYGIPEWYIEENILILENSIMDTIESKGKIPQYAYVLEKSHPFLKDSDDSLSLHLLCKFQAVIEYLDDITFSRNNANSITMPDIANAQIDLNTGEIDTVVSWKEIII